VSRPTLRGALEILERQGWIKTSPGCRRVILRRAPSTASTSTKKVMLLAKESEREMSRMSLLYVESLRSWLRSAGLEFEFHFHPLFGKGASRLIKGLLPRPGAASAYVLFSVSDTVQRCCRDEGYPVVVAGSVAEGVHLPSVDMDYRGIARHAVGLLVGRGHRRLAFLTQQTGLNGDLLTERSFSESAKSFESRGVRAEIVRYREDPADIQAKLKVLWRNPAQRPTGLLIGRAHQVVTVLGTLASWGIRVPEDVSIICRDDEATLNWTVPRIGRYRFSSDRFADLLGGMVEALVKGRAIRRTSRQLTPEFDPGESVGVQSE